MLRTKKVLYQQALLETIQKREKLPPESNKAKLITEKIVDFIVLDDHTLYAVENAGFQGLMEHLVLPNCHFISKQAIPEMYKQLSNFLSECLESIPTLNLTTDIGILDVCPSSFLSLTTQLTDSSFTFTL